MERHTLEVFFFQKWTLFIQKKTLFLVFCVWVQFSFCLKHLSINMDSTNINSIKKTLISQWVLLRKHKVPQHLSKQQQVNLQEMAYMGGMLQSVHNLKLQHQAAPPPRGVAQCKYLYWATPTRDPMRTIPSSSRSLLWGTREMSTVFGSA